MEHVSQRKKLTLAVAGIALLFAAIASPTLAQEDETETVTEEADRPPEVEAPETSTATIAPADRVPTVEAARQITTARDPARLYNNPAIDVAPDDPETFAIAVGDSRNGGCELHISQDAGLSWAYRGSFMPDDRPFCIQRNFGPAIGLDFAPDGDIHLGMSGSSPETEPAHPNGPVDALAARTSDLGETYETSVLAEAGIIEDYELRDGSTADAVEHHKYADVAVDPNNPDTVYRTWKSTVRGVDQEPVPGWALGCPDNCAPTNPMLAVSDDGGDTWSEPVNLLEEGGLDDAFAADTARLVVGNDGTVYAFAHEDLDRSLEDPPPPRLFMLTSDDQGQSWDAETIYGGVPEYRKPTAAIDRDNGNLYLTWEQSGGEDSPANPYFMASTDGGDTWSDPVDLSDDGEDSEINQYLPGISVAPNGRIDVAWYDHRDDPFLDPGEGEEMGTQAGEQFWDVYYTYSTDNGETWAENMRITDRSVDNEVGVTFANQDIRDAIAVASTEDLALFTWSDSRPGGPQEDIEDAYFTRARFPTDTAEPAAAQGDGVPDWVWIVLGAAAALVLAGIIIMIATRMAGSRGT